MKRIIKSWFTRLARNPQHEIPSRFRVGATTLLIDRAMNTFIKIGGIAIIAAVSCIVVFIFLQIWPLFGKAEVEKDRTISLGKRDIRVIAIDEWGELPMILESDGIPRFLDVSARPRNRCMFTVPTGLDERLEFSAFSYNPESANLLMGTRDGQFALITIDYHPRFLDGGNREIHAGVSATPLFPIGDNRDPVELIAHGDNGARKLVAALQRADGGHTLTAIFLEQKVTLFSTGETQVVGHHDLSNFIPDNPTKLLVSRDAESLLIANDAGEVRYLFYENNTFAMRQSFSPFADLDDASIASMDFVLGDISIVFTHPSGAMRAFSLCPAVESGQRIWQRTKTFDSLKQGATYFAASSRNKAFLTGSRDAASLRYATTEDIRWESTLPFQVRMAVLGERYDRMVFLDTDNNLHLYTLMDPHPQAGWRSYFGKIHYEGQPHPSYTWQSTGGSDSFEPKLSLIPLIVGTAKGTVFAMFWALPIAMLAAVYTAQFLKPEVKRFVKPTMEIMASLPSVVLGFLAALWLAPIVSNRVPSVALAAIAVVVGAIICGWLWSKLPVQLRGKFSDGWEFAIFAPIMLIVAYIGWQSGPMVEELLFTVPNPETGERIADFRLWFPLATGLGFEQRNAFVVGFVMGFAVIPLIFTMAEDAMSNVPRAFQAASLALGASRWQTTTRIILPTASPGIFSAVMIGLGRAVGETMIVVMATGNTPVIDLNPFTGMRTLSANIAVELPEAPNLGTLYRTLFLGAMTLLVMTFIVNTIAELMRQRLRQKYRAVE